MMDLLFPMALYPSEWIALTFAVTFMFLGVVERRRGRASFWGVAAAGAMAVIVVVTASAAPVPLRTSMPLLYLPCGYWIPALLRRRPPDPRFTEWLARMDARLSARVSIPGWLVHAADLCYLLCYPLVPACYLALAAGGDAAHRERLWVAVLVAGFSCYATLPWLVSLPPRRIGSRHVVTPRPVDRLNLMILGRVSHGLNTFPSGHAAVATAAALASLPVPAMAATAALVASGVAVGAFAGRHHFVIDIVLGTAVGAVSAAAAWRLV